MACTAGLVWLVSRTGMPAWYCRGYPRKALSCNCFKKSPDPQINFKPEVEVPLFLALGRRSQRGGT
jgi:hypothetical protein